MDTLLGFSDGAASPALETPAGADGTGAGAGTAPGAGAGRASPDALVTEIVPADAWQAIDVRELWQFREVLYFLTWRDVKVRYKQTVLGALWAVLQPAMLMVVFTVFIGRMAKAPTGGVAYPVFVYAGLLPWTLFASSISNAGASVVGSERLITKIYFPRLAIPFASVGAAVVDFAMAFGLLVVMAAWYGIWPGFQWLLAPLLLGIIVLLALGVGTFFAALNVVHRDFRYVVPFMVQLWMFATPSIYMQRATEAGTGNWLSIVNPLVPLVGAFRALLLGGEVRVAPVAIAGVTALVVFFGGCLYFRRMEPRFADDI